MPAWCEGRSYKININTVGSIEYTYCNYKPRIPVYSLDYSYFIFLVVDVLEFWKNHTPIPLYSSPHSAAASSWWCSVLLSYSVLSQRRPVVIETTIATALGALVPRWQGSRKTKRLVKQTVHLPQILERRTQQTSLAQHSTARHGAAQHITAVFQPLLTSFQSRWKAPRSKKLFCFHYSLAIYSKIDYQSVSRICCDFLLCCW